MSVARKMPFFRSEKMLLCTMVLHTESVLECLIELGEMGVVEFVPIDPDNIPNMQYTIEVQRCGEMLRLAKRLQNEADEAGINVVFYPNVDEEERLKSTDLMTLELQLQNVESELVNLGYNREGLLRQQSTLQEHLDVISKVEELISGTKTQSIMAWSGSVIMKLIRDETNEETQGTFNQLSYYAGSMPVDRFATFEVVLWRMFHRNYCMRHAEITDLSAEYKHRKFAFVIFFVGEEIKRKVKRICESFSGVIYEFPEDAERRRERWYEINAELENLTYVVERASQLRRNILSLAAADLFIWRMKIKKLLTIYTVLNRMGVVKQVGKDNWLQTECWIPKSKLAEVRLVLLRGVRRAAKGSGGVMMFPPVVYQIRNRKKRLPPTHFHLNRFTRGFQDLIDAYGMADYQELNPAPYTIITFPFLFAVMFGDIGHGIIMALFAAWLILKEKVYEEWMRCTRGQNEIFSILFAGRYIIFLMGIFSVYTGLIYNDVFSKSFNFFGSHWRVNFTQEELEEQHGIQLNPSSPAHYLGAPYIFGFDPVWGAAGESAITTANSLKMKLAVILGVVQMVFGLALSAQNHLYFKRYSDLILVCLPQIIFMLCLFSYLCFMIFYKWYNFGGHYKAPYHSSCAPSILIVFINMILMKGDEKPPEGCKEHMYSGQAGVQHLLLALAFITVPWLLLGKPLYLIFHRMSVRNIKDQRIKSKVKRATASSVRRSLVYNVEYLTEDSSKRIYIEEESFNLSEVWIHQGIVTIESLLGTVSHTASYLRLWALSLAHEELSSVLWNMVLAKGLKGANPYFQAIQIYILFWVWALLTVSILIVMEGLSAFLHCLRLHWVEFQSKFYSGMGEAYHPFRFEKSTAND